MLTEVQAEVQVEIYAEVQVEVQAEVQVEIKAEIHVEVQTELYTEVHAGVHVETSYGPYHEIPLRNKWKVCKIWSIFHPEKQFQEYLYVGQIYFNMIKRPINTEVIL